MKVLQLTASVSNRAGGLLPIIQGLSHALRDAGLDVAVAGVRDDRMDTDGDTWSPLQPRVAEPFGPRSFGYARDLGSIVEGERPDVVHLHALWMYPSIVARSWSAETGRPYLITVHGMLDGWALGNAHWKKRAALRLYERRTLDGAACLHVNTVREAQDVRALGIRTPLAVVPNGVALPGPATGPAPWAERTGLDARVLLFLGRIHPKKGLDALVDAFARVVPDPAAQGWHLAVVGWDDGGHEDALKRRIGAAGLADRVHVLGPLYGADKEAAYAHADAFVLPSFSEGLPMAVLEAWAHCLPVLMTDACNLPEGFEQGAAVRVAPEAESIADGLRTLFALAPESRRAMGERGGHLVGARFTWPRVAEALSDVYRWVLGQGPIPPCVSLHE